MSADLGIRYGIVAVAIIVVAALVFSSLIVAPTAKKIDTFSSSSTTTSRQTSATTLSQSSSSASSGASASAAIFDEDPAYALLATVPAEPIPGTPLFDPANGDLYAPTNSNQIMVISGSSNAVIANVTVTSGEQQMAFDSNNSDIYVSTFYTGTLPYGVPEPSATVVVISGTTNQVIANVTFPSKLTLLSAPVFDPVNDDIYVTSPTSNLGGIGALWTISGATNQVVDAIGIPLPGSPFFDSANNDIYVPDGQNFTVFAISSTTDKVVDSVTVGDVFSYQALDGDNLYFLSASTRSMVVLSADNTVIATFTFGDSNPAWLVTDTGNGDVYVACTQGEGASLLVVSGKSNSLVANVSIGGDPEAPAVVLTTGDPGGPERRRRQCRCNLGRLQHRSRVVPRRT